MVAVDDKLGRKLQDAKLTIKKRAPKEKKIFNWESVNYKIDN